MKTFGKYAKERISVLGKSQKALAVELKVSPAYISQVISGKKSPPDLCKSRNRSQLKIWCKFLDIPEEDALSLVRHELHRAPLKPMPRFHAMREFLIQRCKIKDRNFLDEIRSMELHPCESKILLVMTQIYCVNREDPSNGSAFGLTRFQDFCNRAKADKNFVENELMLFFSELSFNWSWDSETHEVSFSSEAPAVREAALKLEHISSDCTLIFSRTIPVVGHVSAGVGFEYTDGGFEAGEGFDQVDLPPGVDPNLAQKLYCVRVRGDSLREFFSDGALLFIKPESWEEIKDGDLVIFKDRADNKAYVKKVEFAGESLILKSMNPLYKNMVLNKNELSMLERVLSIVL